MELTWTAIAGLVVSGLIGGIIGRGAVAAAGYRALKDRLKDDLSPMFVQRGELKRMADKTEAWGNLTAGISGRMDTVRDDLVQLRTSHQHRVEHGGQQDRRIDAHSEQIDSIMEKLTRVITILDRIDRRTEATGR